MPRILRHTPQWLNRPAPGFALFANPEGDKLKKNSEGLKPHATRTVTNRGTEIFIAVGNQLRWSDLLLLKEEDQHRRQAERQHHSGDSEGGSDGKWPAYRVRSEFSKYTRPTNQSLRFLNYQFTLIYSSLQSRLLENILLSLLLIPFILLFFRTHSCSVPKIQSR